MRWRVPPGWDVPPPVAQQPAQPVGWPDQPPATDAPGPAVQSAVVPLGHRGGQLE